MIFMMNFFFVLFWYEMPYFGFNDKFGSFQSEYFILVSTINLVSLPHLVSNA